VTEQFTNWRKAKEKFLSHQTKKYHKLAVFSSENQKNINLGNQLPIIQMIDTAQKRQA